MFWLLLGLAALGQTQAGPLDGFRANFASIRAEMDFESVYVTIDKGYREQIWGAVKPVFRANRDDEIDGHWACDGSVELYQYHSSEEVFTRFRSQIDKIKVESSKMQLPMHVVPWTEALLDGEYLASHHHALSLSPTMPPKSGLVWWAIQIERLDRKPAVLQDGRGPFHWGYNFPFPRIIKESYPGVTPTRRRSTRGGRPVEVEIYEMKRGDGVFERFEISYDPSVGFLPRLARRISGGPGFATNSEEMYLIDAKPCSAGGFVPTEWCILYFQVDDFAKRYPTYDDDTVFPSSEPVPAGLFRATSFRDLSGPASLTDLKDVRAIAAQGYLVSLKSHPPHLSLPDVKKLAGKALTDPPRATLLPQLDATERRALDPRYMEDEPSVWPYVALSLLLVGAGLIVWRRRSRGGASGVVVLLLAMAPWFSGCGTASTPVVKLNAAFKDTYVYIQRSSFELPMTLVLRNDGNRPIKIIRANGGCSCRRVDQSSLPQMLAPGKMTTLPVRMTPPGSTSPQSAPFEFETDHGVLGVSVPYFSLISDQSEPDSVSSTALDENEPWSFELTHRRVYLASLPLPANGPVFPAGFKAERLEESGGKVGGAEEYLYHDQKYRLTLTDSALGLQKALITIPGPDARPALEVPIVWERLPFLASNPRRVFLASRPVRVFLQCRDDSVELTRVLRAPPGVKAVIASPRELIVSPTTDAPPSLDGSIEVETNAKGKAPLGVRVTRYTAQASR